jgi:hypothetical protein
LDGSKTKKQRSRIGGRGSEQRLADLKKHQGKLAFEESP